MKHMSCNQQVYLANGAMAHACVVVFWSVLTATPGVAAALAALVACGALAGPRVLSLCIFRVWV